MKNHFLIPYSGNKRTEVEKIYNSIKDNLDEIEYIIEPFCGTSAFSFYMSKKHPKRFKYILNDNNKLLIELYETAKDDDKLNELIKTLDNLLIDLDKEKYNSIIKINELPNYIIKQTIYSIRAGLFPLDKKNIRKNYSKLKDVPIINFLKNEDIKLYNEDSLYIYEMYKDNKKALIFLDPPYLMACNDFYQDSKVNIYEYLYNNDINKTDALILLALEENWIIKLLFSNNKFIIYDKMYQLSKKKTKHLIITNKNLN